MKTNTQLQHTTMNKKTKLSIHIHADDHENQHTTKTVNQKLMTSTLGQAICQISPKCMRDEICLLQSYKDMNSASFLNR